jgi:hypothetical protein
MKGFVETLLYGLCVFSVVVFVCLGVGFVIDKNQLEKEIERLKNYEPIHEAEIIGFNDAVVYVYDDELEHFIEVDIFHELIHCTIEVGDIAVYVVYYDGSDADLLNIIKKQ